MRLIKTKTLELIEVWEDARPTYAILSHRWTDEEVSLAEFVSPTVATREKAGWLKIEACARLASGDGYDHLWIDTCCIDKTSSAELSEAINSMYRWYKQAGVCYVHMNDVTLADAFATDDHDPPKTTFERSQWHTRGWTLQELLAPADVRFYSNEWSRLTRDDLTDLVSRATGVGRDVLDGSIPVHSVSVASRMSWASCRRTTRPEDMAYCLLGLFDVNMPLLYGEGHKAFRRLQDEVMEQSDDQSLFVWSHTETDPEYTGLLAAHPRNFRGVIGFEDVSKHQEFTGQSHVARREGISLNLFLLETTRRDKKHSHPGSRDSLGKQNPSFTAMLKCIQHNNSTRFASLRLVKFGSHFLRYHQPDLECGPLLGDQQDLLVLHSVPSKLPDSIKRQYLHIAFASNCPNAFASPATSLDFEDLGLTTNDACRPLHRRTTRPFVPSKASLADELPLDDLKWAVPLLPARPIALLRFFVPGFVGRSFPLRIGKDTRGRIGFEPLDLSKRLEFPHELELTEDNVRDDCQLRVSFKPYERVTDAGEVGVIHLFLHHSALLRPDLLDLQDTESDRFDFTAEQCLCATLQRLQDEAKAVESNGGKPPISGMDVPVRTIRKPGHRRPLVVFGGPRGKSG